MDFVIRTQFLPLEYKLGWVDQADTCTWNISEKHPTDWDNTELWQGLLQFKWSPGDVEGVENLWQVEEELKNSYPHPIIYIFKKSRNLKFILVKMMPERQNSLVVSLMVFHHIQPISISNSDSHYDLIPASSSQYHEAILCASGKLVEVTERNSFLKCPLTQCQEKEESRWKEEIVDFNEENRKKELKIG